MPHFPLLISVSDRFQKKKGKMRQKLFGTCGNWDGTKNVGELGECSVTQSTSSQKEIHNCRNSTKISRADLETSLIKLLSLLYFDGYCMEHNSFFTKYWRTRVSIMLLFETAGKLYIYFHMNQVCSCSTHMTIKKNLVYISGTEKSKCKSALFLCNRVTARQENYACLPLTSFSCFHNVNDLTKFKTSSFSSMWISLWSDTYKHITSKNIEWTYV